MSETPAAHSVFHEVCIRLEVYRRFRPTRANCELRGDFPRIHRYSRECDRPNSSAVGAPLLSLRWHFEPLRPDTPQLQECAETVMSVLVVLGDQDRRTRSSSALTRLAIRVSSRIVQFAFPESLSKTSTPGLSQRSAGRRIEEL